MTFELTTRDMDRFWSFVQKSDDDGGCWLWTGAARRRGDSYGAFQLCRLGISRQYSAHRIAFIIANGTIPAGLLVLHRCDVRMCVRPDHLFAGTASDNTRDAVEKGRVIPPKPRILSNGQIAYVRSMYRKRYGAVVALARELGVSRYVVDRVVRGEVTD